MHLNQVIELSMVLDHEKFHRVLMKVSEKNYLEKNEKEYIDQSLAARGILVVYRNSQYKKRVKLIVNSGLVLDCESPDSNRFIHKLEKRISEYFHAEYHLEDFHLARMVLMTDIDVGTQGKVSAYIKVLQRIGRVKGFSPVNYEGIDESISFCLEGNSNGIEFLLYDLAGVIVKRRRNTATSPKELNSILEKSEGILRAEVRLTKPKAIRVYTNEIEVTGQIAELSKRGGDIFLDTLTRIIPFGDFYKKEKAVEIIQSRVTNTILRRRMLHLLMLIPEKKSLLLAQKALNYRNIEKIMAAFEEINVSPITISKRHDVKHLKCFYTYLFNEK